MRFHVMCVLWEMLHEHKRCPRMRFKVDTWTKNTDKIEQKVNRQTPSYENACNNKYDDNTA